MGWDFQLEARRAVQAYFNQRRDKSDSVFLELSEIYVVWFSKTLENWKALVSTTVPDLMYYEVTYNGQKKEMYLDAYRKVENIVIKDNRANYPAGDVPGSADPVP
jgi:Family of unknown function (DUF6275)